MHDVAIVGAGPGGATTALYLAKKGVDVCLIDKAVFPRDKPCGGGFAYSLVNEFPWLRSKTSEFIESIDRVAVLHSPNHRVTMTTRVDLITTLREKFDTMIFRKAQDAGATTLENARVKSFKVSDHVHLNLSDGREVQARALVGADGVNSIVARQLGLRGRWTIGDVIPCQVAEIPLGESTVEQYYTSDRQYHFYASFGGGGYGWIFPKRETVNVGLGILGGGSKGLPTKFRIFVNKIQRDGILPKHVNLSSTRGALVPISGTLKKTYSNRAILVGDSASMVHPITGGGIHYAMMAGRIAASVLTSALETDQLDDQSLCAYQRIWWSTFGHTLNKQLLAQKVIVSSFLDVLFEIGHRDPAIQDIVSNAFSETSDGDIKMGRLAARVFLVCLKSALGLYRHQL